MPQVAPISHPGQPVNSQALEKELRSALEGEVRFDRGCRALYATDGSNYRQVPIGVVLPKSKADVIETLRICREHGAPVLARGGGTSLAGQCCNVAVVLDFTKYLHHVLEIDPARKLARVEPGTILDHLRNSANEVGLTFAPDPSTHNHCVLGGMIGNNSCGTHSMMAGRTADNVEELEILTYDGVRMRVGRTSDLELARIIAEGGRRGEIYARLKALRDKYAPLIRARYPKIPRRVSGYNLDDLLPENGFHVARALVGSEGTCVTILESTVNLVPNPPCRAVLVLGYPDVYQAADHIPQIVEYEPIALEGLDNQLIEDTIKTGIHKDAREHLPEGQGWLVAEFGGDTQAAADTKARLAMARVRLHSSVPKMKLYENQEHIEEIWKIRESGLGATARVPGAKVTWEGWEDSAVPPERLGEYLRKIRALFNKYDYGCALYGHFGQGCLHTRIDFDLESEPGIKKYRAFMDEATSLVVSLGGSLSGEHGDGQSRAEFLGKMFGPELLEAFREFKSIWDPEWKMNPGKIVDPYKIDENLRLGPDFSPVEVRTHFQFPDDRGNLPFATTRCVGVGECRKTDHGFMCPSYMVTREEKHSTRGRAHLLFELFSKDDLAGRGSSVKNRWRSEEVKSALDLCLSCKGCKKECPVSVDMATYKAEFLSHYYQGRLRPRSAYAFGLINIWARLASKVPRLANFMTQTPVLRRLAKWGAGMAQERSIPKFSTWTFREWFRARSPRNVGFPRVVFWADTFNNYFRPKTAVAAVEVLEAAGFQVLVPAAQVCCGRPLYDYGMLGMAKSYLRNVLTALRPYIREGLPMVGIEPSCVAVFRDEMRGMLPEDLDARRLREQTFYLTEFLEQKAPQFRLPRLKAKALVQTHCHHHALLDPKKEKAVLDKLGVEAEILDSGCCGMAGSFGFESEAGRYEISQKVGERKLLPRVRAAEDQTLIIADGFSCREQIQQSGGRRAHHTAEVLQMALRLQAKAQGESQMKPLRRARRGSENQPLFNAAESFNRALSLTREFEGEAFQGGRSWIRRNRGAVTGLGLVAMVAAATTGILINKKKAA